MNPRRPARRIQPTPMHQNPYAPQGQQGYAPPDQQYQQPQAGYDPNAQYYAQQPPPQRQQPQEYYQQQQAQHPQQQQQAARSGYQRQAYADGGAMVAAQAGFRPFVPVIQLDEARRVAFLKKVYTWFAAGIATMLGTAAVSAMVLMNIAQSPGGAGTFQSMWWVAIVVWMISSFVLARMVGNPRTEKFALFAYNALMGVVVSFMLVVAFAMTGSLAPIGTALILTLLTFGGLTGYVLVSKADLSWMRGMLVVGSAIALGVVLVAILSPMLGWNIMAGGGPLLSTVIAGFFVLLMGGFTLYDTSKVLHKVPEDRYVAAAAHLSIDFGVLFYYILWLVLMITGRD